MNELFVYCMNEEMYGNTKDFDARKLVCVMKLDKAFYKFSNQTATRLKIN